MVDWPTLFGIVQTVADERGASQQQHQSLASELGDWWNDGGKEIASNWSRAEARDWAESNVEV